MPTFRLFLFVAREKPTLPRALFISSCIFLFLLLLLLLPLFCRCYQATSSVVTALLRSFVEPFSPLFSIPASFTKKNRRNNFSLSSKRVSVVVNLIYPKTTDRLMGIGRHRGRRRWENSRARQAGRRCRGICCRPCEMAQQEFSQIPFTLTNLAHRILTSILLQPSTT